MHYLYVQSRSNNKSTVLKYFFNKHFGWLAFLTAIGLFLLFWQGCFDKKQKDAATIIKTDTVYVHHKRGTQYIPKVDTIFYPKKVYLPGSIVTKEITIPHFIDTAQSLREYYSVKEYSDTQYVQYGRVIISDKISTNKIISRLFETDFSIPEVTTTTIVPRKKRNLLFINAGIWGNQQSPLWGIETGLSFQTKKNDRVYSINGMLNKSGDVLYNFRIQIPLKTRK